jgi:hypothetical protein
MNNPELLIAELKIAVQAALDGDWDKSHKIAQDYTDDTANWIHAVLHKIEGDEWNSKYWYARTEGKKHDDFSDVNAELKAIQNSLNPI